MKLFKITGRLLLSALLLAALVLPAAADEIDDFDAGLEANLRAQNEQFTLDYDGALKDLTGGKAATLVNLLRAMAARSPDGPDCADGPFLNVIDGALSWKNGYAQVTIDYLSTPEELAEVDRRAAEIIEELDLGEADDFTKVRLIYEYVTQNFTYDLDEEKYAAYDGLTTGEMVCQGFALLTAGLCREAGVPCRVVVGVSQGENHAWNIVELDGLWYNLDTTWDARIDGVREASWRCFLKADQDLNDHTRFESHNSEAFRAAHPMAAESYSLRAPVILSDGREPSVLICRVGIPAALEAELPEGVDAEIVWTSSDPEVVSVDENGVVEALRPGAVIVTCEAAGREDLFPRQLVVGAVDLTTASPWAYESVTEYYLAQLLPNTLCEDFQRELTRAELSRLLFHYVLREKGWGFMSIENRFHDIGQSPDLAAILRCEKVGLMKGVSATSFDPEGIVTREQASVVLSRLIEYVTGEAPARADGKAFTDAGSISAWAKESVGAISELKILRGAKGLFRPGDPMTREEMILALNRVHELYPQPEPEANAA